MVSYAALFLHNGLSQYELDTCLGPIMPSHKTPRKKASIAMLRSIADAFGKPITVTIGDKR